MEMPHLPLGSFEKPGGSGESTRTHQPLRPWPALVQKAPLPPVIVNLDLTRLALDEAALQKPTQLSNPPPAAFQPEHERQGIDLLSGDVKGQR